MSTKNKIDTPAIRAKITKAIQKTRDRCVHRLPLTTLTTVQATFVTGSVLAIE